MDKLSAPHEIEAWEKATTEIFKKEHNKEFKLTADQKKVLESLLTTKDGLIVIQGDAGTGKTTLLKAFNEITAACEIELAGLSTTGKAVREIIEQSNIKARTIDSHNLQSSNIQSFIDSNGKKIYIVDESSMNATLKIKDVISRAEKENARVVLIGDIKQLASIQAGGMFERMQKSKDVTFVEMKESIRQIDPLVKDVVKTIAAGNVIKGLEMLDAAKKINEVTDINELYKQITDAYVKEKNLNNFILSAQNKDRYELNKITREKLKEQGAIEKEDVQLKIREGKSINDHEKKQIWNYKEGDVIVRGKHSYQVKDVDKENKILTVVNKYSGKEISMTPKKNNEVYIEVERNFSKGDKIVFLKNEYHIGVDNGMTGFIRNIEKAENGNYKVEIDTGKKTVNIETKNYNYFTHAYAITSYKSQGQTAEKVFVYSDRTTKNETYVNLSRAKIGAEVWTMSKENLFKTAKKNDKQIDSITLEQRNYKNHSVIIDLYEKINIKIENVMEMLNKGYGDISKRKDIEQKQDDSRKRF